MDFFQAQESARSRSRTLVLLFIAAVVAIIVTIYAVVHVALGPGIGGAIDWGLLLLVALGTTLLVAAGSTFRTIQLRQGGARVAEMLGGRRIRPNTTDEAERRLVNVVEEMAIASGTPVPAIFVLDREQGINAFAAGYTLDDAAIAVTHGTLTHLNRDELQGVIAHEFSHVLNGDMRLNIRLIGLLFGILLLAVVGRTVLYGGARGGRGRRDNNGGQVALVGIALIVVGYIGVFFGRLIQAAVSRQREYLADAAAVQFTRNPDGLAGALKKIGGAGSRLANPHAQEASHLFFATGLRSSFIGLLSTHPPLTDRIQRIDPTFAGEFPKLSPDAPAIGVPRGGTLEGALATGLAGGSPAESSGAQALAHATDGAPVRGEALLASIGAPQPKHVAYAAHLLRSLPRPVLDAAHDPDGAVALLLALLLHDHGPAASAQQRAIEAYGGAELRTRVEALSRGIAPIGPAARLPLLDLLLPAARGGDLSPDQALGLHDTAQAMIEADGRMDAFELALLHVVGRQLTAVEHGRQDGNGSGIHSLGPLHHEVETVLSAIAWSGAPDEETAVPAFAAAAASLDSQGNRATLRPRGSVTIEQVDEALARLRAAAAPVRRRFLNACMQAVAHDGLVDVDEAELLRAVAEALDCPMPPLVGTMTL
jgi:Zn-dependent protease with chaperone function